MGPLSLPILSGARVESSFGVAKRKMQVGAEDVNILIVGDSTGDGSTEWPRLLATWLAAQYPAYTVKHYLWNDAGPSYGAATTVSTGSGSYTLSIYNASVGGSEPWLLLGAKKAAAIDAITAPSAIIINHGLNIRSAPSKRGLYLQLSETLRLTHPTASQVMFLENPMRDDDTMAAVDTVLRQIAADYGDVTTIDVYSAFIAAGKPTGWYADDTHPTAATHAAVHLPLLQAAWRNAASSSRIVNSAFLGQTATNLLPNGDFAAFSGAVPDNFTIVGGTGATTKELVIVDGASAYSVKLTGTGAGVYMRNTLTGASATALRGKTLTLAVRMYVPTGAASTVGQIWVEQNNGATATDLTAAASDIARGGWVWQILTGFTVPSDATTVRCSAYCDTASNTDSAVYFDRWLLVEGNMPRDMA